MTIIYCRKSSEAEDRQVQSIDSQIAELTSLAQKRGLVIDKVFTESMSAKAVGRPEFNNLLDTLRKHPGCIVLAWKADRLARNFRDGGEIMSLLQEGVIAEVATPFGSFLPNDNVIPLAVEFGMANQYVRNLSTDVKRGNKTKLERGELPGPAPFGYSNDVVSHTIVVNKAESPIVQQLFNLYATGSYNMRSVADLLYAKGLKTKSGRKYTKSMIQRTLNNPFYYGVIRRNGEHYPGKHTPLITRELFDQVKIVLSGKAHPKQSKHFFPVRGYLRCAQCSCLVTAEKQRGHVYYHCTNGKGHCNQKRLFLKAGEVDALVASLLAKLELDEEMIEITYLAAKERAKMQTHGSIETKTSLTKQLQELQERQSTLIDLVADGTLTREAYKAKSALLENQMVNLQQQIKVLEHQKDANQESTFEQTKKTFLQAHFAQKEYLNADDTEKRKLLEILLSNIYLADKKVQSYQLKQPYQLLTETPKNNDLNHWLGLVNNIITYWRNTSERFYVPTFA